MALARLMPHAAPDLAGYSRNATPRVELLKDCTSVLSVCIVVLAGDRWQAASLPTHKNQHGPRDGRTRIGSRREDG